MVLIASLPYIEATGRVEFIVMPDTERPFIINVLQLNGSLTLFDNLHPFFLIVVSWSPKGKQLALAVTGAISGAAASNSGNTTSIVQVDPDLKVKRIIPIGDLLKDRLKGMPILSQHYCHLPLVVLHTSNSFNFIQICITPYYKL